MLIHNAEVTGSLTINNVPFNSGSFSGSFRGDGSQLTGITGATTASYVEYSNVGNKPALVSSSAQIVGYGIFATTGSNQFNGSQAITGSLTVTGQVVAQTLNVQQVTSSIVFSSGSNIFGNTQSNTQQFTGSVSVTGSLTVTTTGTELQVTSTGVNLGNALTDSHIISGSLRVNPNGLFVSGSGNVGIGTTSPSFQLDLGGGTTNNTRLRLQRGSDDTSQNALYGWNSITVQRTTVALSSAQTDFSIIQQGSDGSRTPFYISSGGNVGIGTTSPSTKLDIRISDPTTYTTSSVGNTLTLYNTSPLNNAFVGIDFLGEPTSGNAGRAAINMITVGSGDSNLAFSTRGSSVLSERMRITSGGNVGIGTASPGNFSGLTFTGPFLDVAGLMQIKGTSANTIAGLQFGGDTFRKALIYSSVGTADPYFAIGVGTTGSDSSATERMRIASNGIVTIYGNLLLGTIAGGISTSSPNSISLASTFSDTGGSNLKLKLFEATGGLIYGIGVSNARMDFNVPSGAAYSFYTGNVLIGTTTDAGTNQPLQVIKAGSSNYLRIQTDNNASYDCGLFFSDGTNAVYSGMLRASSGVAGAYSIITGGSVKFNIPSSGNIILNTNLELSSGANREIIIGSVTNYNYRLRTDGDDFAIREANSTDRLRYSYTNVRWTITGGLVVSGALSKGSGSFRIDHPLPSKKDTHHLVHSFIEGPQADNIYRGKIQLVNGKATINLDQAAKMTEGTFILLNGNTQCFTSNESGWTAVKGIVEGNILTIEAQDPECTDTISWLVVGERIDQHMLDTDWTDENGKVIVEPLKTE